MQIFIKKKKKERRQYVHGDAISWVKEIQEITNIDPIQALTHYVRFTFLL